MGIKKPRSHSHLAHPGHGGTHLTQLPQRRSLCCRCDIWSSQGVPERDPKAQASLERTETEEVSCRARAQIPALSQNTAGTATTGSCHTTSSHSAPLRVDWGLRGKTVTGSLVAQGHGPMLAAERQGMEGSTQATQGKGDGDQDMDMPGPPRYISPAPQQCDPASHTTQGAAFLCRGKWRRRRVTQGGSWQRSRARTVLAPVTSTCSAQTPAMPGQEPTRRAVTTGHAAGAISSHQLCSVFCTLLPVLQAHALSFLRSNKSNPSSLDLLCQTFSSSMATSA